MSSRIRVGLKSTKIVLTEVGKKWFTEAYPQGIVYEYDPDGTFDIKSMGADFVEVLCPMGIPYRLPTKIDEVMTWQMADKDPAAAAAFDDVEAEA